MVALNALALAPISVLSYRRTDQTKFSSLPTTSLFKFPTFPSFKANPSKKSANIHSGLVLLSSILSTLSVRALTYEEALRQSMNTSKGSFEFDFNGFLDNFINFGVENPTVIAGGVAILAVPLVLSQVLSKPKPWGVESAKTAYAKLGDDANAQLVDIRALVELREVGRPDIGALKKKVVSVVYKGEDKLGFLKKLSSKFKEPESTTLFILDKFDGNSELVAELVTANGFKAAYAIEDGAEGSRGWKNSGLPWIPPKQTLSLDLSNLTDAIGGVLEEGYDSISVTLGLAAAAGLSLLAYSEVETILELLGSAALVQFITKKLLFAEDRKQTLLQVDEFVTTKVAPKELAADIMRIGKALLPSPVTSKALPAPAEASPPDANNIVQKEAGVPNVNSKPPKVESTAEPAPEINSVPKVEVKENSLPGFSRSLSPYPNYPDLRPPTSPTPSKP